MNDYIVYEKIGCKTCDNKGSVRYFDAIGLEKSSLCGQCNGNGYTLKPYDLEIAMSIVFCKSRILKNDIRMHCLDLEAEA